MRTLTLGLLVSLVWTASACQGERDDEEPASTGAKPASRLVPQIEPPLDLKAPPDDANKTASGLAFKKLTSRDAGSQPRRNDTVLVQYTGWSQRTGSTFFTTKGNGQAIALDVGHAAHGVSEALQLLRKGERAVLWVPPGQGTDDTLVYEVEVIDIVSTPSIAEPTPQPPTLSAPNHE